MSLHRRRSAANLRSLLEQKATGHRHLLQLYKPKNPAGLHQAQPPHVLDENSCRNPIFCSRLFAARLGEPAMQLRAKPMPVRRSSMVELPTWKVDGRVSPIDAEKSARKDADDSLAILIDNIPLYLASVVHKCGLFWTPVASSAA